MGDGDENMGTRMRENGFVGGARPEVLSLFQDGPSWTGPRLKLAGSDPSPTLFWRQFATREKRRRTCNPNLLTGETPGAGGLVLQKERRLAHPPPASDPLPRSPACPSRRDAGVGDGRREGP